MARLVLSKCSKTLQKKYKQEMTTVQEIDEAVDDFIATCKQGGATALQKKGNLAPDFLLECPADFVDLLGYPINCYGFSNVDRFSFTISVLIFFGCS